MAGVLAMICAVVLRRASFLDESVESERVRLVARDCALVLMVSVCAYASTYACTADTIFSYYAEAVGVLVCAFIFVFYSFFFLRPLLHTQIIGIACERGMSHLQSSVCCR